MARNSQFLLLIVSGYSVSEVRAAVCQRSADEPLPVPNPSSLPPVGPDLTTVRPARDWEGQTACDDARPLFPPHYVLACSSVQLALLVSPSSGEIHLSQLSSEASLSCRCAVNAQGSSGRSLPHRYLAVWETLDLISEKCME